MSLSWSHEQITYCSCSLLSYKHAHCPCSHCGGKAVARSTEYQHWMETNAEQSNSRDTSMYPATDSVLGENHVTHTTCTEAPAETEARSNTGELLPYKMGHGNSQETNTEQDNNASVTDMELDTVEQGPQSLAEQSANESPQQDISCILTTHVGGTCSYVAIDNTHACPSYNSYPTYS